MKIILKTIKMGSSQIMNEHNDKKLKAPNSRAISNSEAVWKVMRLYILLVTTPLQFVPNYQRISFHLNTKISAISLLYEIINSQKDFSWLILPWIHKLQLWCQRTSQKAQRKSVQVPTSENICCYCTMQNLHPIRK